MSQSPGELLLSARNLTEFSIMITLFTQVSGVLMLRVRERSERVRKQYWWWSDVRRFNCVSRREAGRPAGSQ